MALTGMWLTGIESALPAAGVAARLYFATDTSRIFLDTGSAWVRLNLIPRGAYAGGTTYYPLDLVTYNGSVWRALATVTGVTPVEGANWTLFVSKGDAGSGLASIDGVSNTGGDVDLVAGSNVTITPNDAANTITFAATGGSPPFSDSLALVQDNIDSTKKMNIECADIGTGQWRSLTMPNFNVDLAALVNANIASGAAIAESKLNLASDAAAGTASRRTLGTGATQAAPGNDARFTHYSIRDWAFQGTLTTTTGTMRVPIHATGTITGIRAMVNTVPTGASIIIDVNKNGTTLYTTQGNRPTIAISGNAVNATLPDVTSLAAGDYLTVDIDQVGSTIAGANLVVSVRYSY